MAVAVNSIALSDMMLMLPTRLHGIASHNIVIFTHFYVENHLRKAANRRKTNAFAVFFSGK
jgi:hypothetical protein